MVNTGKTVQGFILDPDAGSVVNTFKPNDKVCPYVALLPLPRHYAPDISLSFKPRKLLVLLGQ